MILLEAAKEFLKRPQKVWLGITHIILYSLQNNILRHLSTNLDGKEPCKSNEKMTVVHELVTKPWSLSSFTDVIEFREKKEVFRNEWGHLFKKNFLDDIFKRIEKRIVIPRQNDKSLQLNFKTQEVESCNAVLKR